MSPVDPSSRRAFLAFVGASPFFAAAGIERTTVARLFAGSRRDQSEALTLVEQTTQDAALISSPGEALNVFDFEPVARKRIPVAHWGYLMTGTDDDATVRANRRRVQPLRAARATVGGRQPDRSVDRDARRALG